MHRDRNYSGGCLGLGAGEVGSYWLMGAKFQFGKMKFWRLVVNVFNATKRNAT